MGQVDDGNDVKADAAATQPIAWIYPATTVVFLGECCPAGGRLNVFRSQDSAQFRHVAIDWYFPHFIDLISLYDTSFKMADTCPALETVIIGRVAVNSAKIQVPLGRNIAALYAGLSQDPGPIADIDDTDQPEFRENILRCFSVPSPRLHIVGYCGPNWPSGSGLRPTELWGCVVRTKPGSSLS